ncbi:MAG: succinyldiaminopimelate transaminase [Magnetococcus sp. DMHC-6]
MNQYLKRLHAYPFEKFSGLLEGIVPLKTPCLDLSIGEPKHPVPEFIRQTMANSLHGIGQYPTTKGYIELRQAIVDWLTNRYQLPPGLVEAERHVLPVNGTREALFSITQALVDHTKNDPLVLMPNPFYQIYEGATWMVGAHPVRVDCLAKNGFLPEYHTLSTDTLNRVQLAYLCTPSNPTGTVLPLDYLKKWIHLAHEHNFILASDECYSEIWQDSPPPGLLQAAFELGLKDFSRCLVFNSLSKRSNMPGARSGFVAGDPELLAIYFQLRTYTGCATPPFIQRAACAAWKDETHVEENRALYRQKINEALEILTPHLPCPKPDAGFYLWLPVPSTGEIFAKELFRNQNVKVLPGAYLARPDNDSENPGTHFVRIALVAPLTENREAMQRIAEFVRHF